MKQKIIVITGATASGKTNLAIQLAKAINAEIICADSRIVYKNFDIVSAKPTPLEQEGIKHHLIDIVEADSMFDFSAGDFVNYANCAIEEIEAKKKNIIVSGGTWFYIKSLLDDKKLPECPINPKLRKELETLDKMVLWEKLNLLDSKRAALIHPNNKDKVIRSIEMCLTLNKPISEFTRDDNKEFNSIWFMPDLDRETIYSRINKRVDTMIEAGLFEEWQKNKELYQNTKVMYNTIGYKEFFDYSNKDTAIDKIKQHTRNFAKRQLTYFRSNKDIKLINNIDNILNYLKAQK